MTDFHFVQNGVLWLAHALNEDISNPYVHLEAFYAGVLLARFLNTIDCKRYTRVFIAKIEASKDENPLKLVIEAVDYYLFREYNTIVSAEWKPHPDQIPVVLSSAAKLITMVMYMTMKHPKVSLKLADIFSDEGDAEELMVHIQDLEAFIIRLNSKQREAILALPTSIFCVNFDEKENKKPMFSDQFIQKTERAELVDKIEFLKAKISNQEEEVSDLKSRLHHYEMQNNQVSMLSPLTAAHADAIVYRLETANRVKEKLEENLAQKTKELTVLVTEYAELESKYNNANNKLKTLQDNFNLAKEESQKLAEDLEMTRNQVRDFNVDRERFRTLVEALEERTEYLETLEQEKCELQEKIVELNLRIDEYHDIYAENEQLREELYHFPLNEPCSSEPSLANVTPLSDDLVSNVLDNDQCVTMAQCENQILQLSHEVQLLNVKLEETKIAHQKVLTQVRTVATNKINELNETILKLKNELSDYYEQIKKYKIQKADMRSRLQNMASILGNFVIFMTIMLFCILMYFKFTNTPIFASRESMVKHLKAVDDATRYISRRFS